LLEVRYPAFMLSPKSGATLAMLLLAISCGTDPQPTAAPQPAQSTATSASAASASSAPPAGAVVLDTKAGGGSVALVPSAAVAGAPTGGERPKSMPVAPNGLVEKKVADGIVKMGDPPKLSVLSSGSAPHEKLVYEFGIGKSVQLNLGMKMRLKMNAGGRQMPAPEIPKVNMLFDLTAKAKAPNGDFELDAGVRSATVNPKGPLQEQIAVKMQPQLDAMKGVRVHYFVSPSGRVRDVDVKVTPGNEANSQQTLGQMTQSFESMVAPLPDEAVGVGAKWEVISRVSSSGADLLQWATYELTAREGTAMTIGLSVHQLAADSAISAPGMPAGMKASLRRMHSEGRGQTKLDLTSPAPLGGGLDVQSVMEIAVDPGGAAMPPGGLDAMTVDSHVTLDFSRPSAKK